MTIFESLTAKFREVRQGDLMRRKVSCGTSLLDVLDVK